MLSTLGIALIVDYALGAIHLSHSYFCLMASLILV